MNTQRYSVVLPWGHHQFEGGYAIEVADLLDKRTGRTYVEGAFRVIDCRTGKPVKGKGGTSPFAGESAWSDAERLLRDLAVAERWAR